MSDFQHTISEIRAIRKLLQATPKEEKSVTIKERQVGVIGEGGAIDRDGRYTELLETYLLEYETSKNLMYAQKRVFFYTILTFLGILIISGVAILFFALFREGLDDGTALAAIIGASVDILVSFIAIPLVIAKHLFPEKVDNDIIDVVKLLVENDNNIRDVVERHNKKSVDDGEL